MKFRHYLLLLICLLLSVPTFAQEQSPYDMALARIAEAEASGTTGLDLSWLDLTELPPEIWNLSNLQALSLGNNQLSNLPSGIGNLSYLQSLSLDGNQLSSLPLEIGNLSSLQWLYLDDNQLSSLPPEIGNLSQLCALDVQNNQLRQLPVELADLQRLVDGAGCTYYGLYIGGNPLIAPPEAVLNQGTEAIFAYLNNQVWWHLQRLIIGGASLLGLFAGALLIFRWRRRGSEKKKRA